MCLTFFSSLSSPLLQKDVFLGLIHKLFLEAYCSSQKNLFQKNEWAKHNGAQKTKPLHILHIWLYIIFIQNTTGSIYLLIMFYLDITVYHCKIYIWTQFLHPEIRTLLTIFACQEVVLSFPAHAQNLQNKYSILWRISQRWGADLF